MPPISIVSLATPLYAIYTELATLYGIYGNEVFLNVLFQIDPTAKEESNLGGIPPGFAKEQVERLVETIYDKLFEFQHEIMELKQKYAQIVRGNIFSIICFIILIVLFLGGAAVILILKGLKGKTKDDAEAAPDCVEPGQGQGQGQGQSGGGIGDIRFDYIIWGFLALITMCWLILMAVMYMKYLNHKAKVTYVTNLDTFPQAINIMISNLFGRSLEEYISTGAKTVMTYENAVLPYFQCNAIGCTKGQTNQQIIASIQNNSHYMTIGLLGWILVRKNKLTDLDLWTRVRRWTLERFQIATKGYDKFTVWRIFSQQFSAGTEFHPKIVLRAIQQLDPTYQSNALQTSIKRIAEFMHRDNDKEKLNENVVVAQTLQKKLAGILGTPLIYTQSIAVHTKWLEQGFHDISVTNRMDCIIKAVKNPQYVAAFWQDGKAYFFRKMPRFCYTGRTDDTLGCVIKAGIGIKCFVGLAMYNTMNPSILSPANQNELYKIVNNKDPPVNSFVREETLHGGFTTWLPRLNNTIDVWGILKGADDDLGALKAPALQDAKAFVVMDSLKLVGEYSQRMTGATGTYIDVARRFYTRACMSLFEYIDPNLTVKIDNKFVSDMVSSFQMQPGGRTRAAIETDILSIMSNAREAVRKLESPHTISLKYIDLSRFSEKLMNLSEKAFMTGLLQDYMISYSTAHGLYILQRGSDIRKYEINWKEQSLLWLFIYLIVCIILSSTALAIMFSDKLKSKYLLNKDGTSNYDGVLNQNQNQQPTKTCHPKIKLDWKSIADSWLTVLIVGVILRSALLLTFIWVTKVRVRIMGDFDIKVCGDRARQVMKSTVDIYNCLFVNNIAAGDKRIFSENSPLLNLSSENIINVYDKLERKLYVSSDRQIDVSNVNLKQLYVATINLLEGMEGCNDLIQGFNMPKPFPMFEISLWAIVIIISIAIIIALWMYIPPGKSLENIRLFRRMLAEGKTLQYQYKDPVSDVNVESLIRLSTLISMPIFIIGFCVLIVMSTKQLNNSLYSSVTPMIPLPPS